MLKLKLAECGFEGTFYDRNVSGTKAVILTMVFDGDGYFCRYLARWLNYRNVAALGLTTFGKPGMQHGQERMALDYVETAAAWLKERGYAQVGIMGQSFMATAISLHNLLFLIRKEMEGIPGFPPSEITFDIVVNPLIRKWEYLSETNRRMVELCKPSRFRLEQLNDEETQKVLVEEFSNYLKTFNPLSYDVEHIYPVAITLNEGEKYGMPPKEFSKFCKWYTDLMAENMEFNGVPFTLVKEEDKKDEKKK